MKKKKILIVEDDKSIADYVQALVGLAGHEGHVAGDGEEAVKKVRKVFPDLVLLDIMLPKMSGFDVCHMIRNDPALKTTPVIMMTSLGQMGDVERAFALGANDYIVKPFDTDRLLQKIKKFLDA